MRLPNGYGSVYKLPGNRRKPWAVRIVASRSESPDGTPRFKYKVSLHNYFGADAQSDFSSDETKTGANTLCISEDFCEI